MNLIIRRETQISRELVLMKPRQPPQPKTYETARQLDLLWTTRMELLPERPIRVVQEEILKEYCNGRGLGPGLEAGLSLEKRGPARGSL